MQTEYIIQSNSCKCSINFWFLPWNQWNNSSKFEICADFHGINKNCLDMLVKLFLIFSSVCLFLHVSHVYCYSFHFVYIIPHFIECLNINYVNWIKQVNLESKKSWFVVFWIFTPQPKGELLFGLYKYFQQKKNYIYHVAKMLQFIFWISRNLQFICIYSITGRNASCGM